MKNKKIAVVMGGPSAEREVSLNTGQAILKALKEKGYRAEAIDLSPRSFFQDIKDQEIDIVFNAIHGKYGEDGGLQGVLEFLGVPYTGSGVLASAVAMDKKVSKQLFSAAGILTPEAGVYHKKDFNSEAIAEIVQKFGIPVVVKPNEQGSSIGVVIVEDGKKLKEALDQAFEYGDQIMAEKFIKGRELTVSILGNEEPEALPIIEIIPNSGKYDFHSKYTKGATTYIVPADIDADLTDKIQKASLAAYKLLGCRGFGRVDLMLSEDNLPYVLEVNTMPGMTATSLVPKAAAAAGISFADLCERILFMAVE